MAYPKTMTTQKAGRDLIKNYEGYSEVAYFPTDAERKIGIYTIGRGHRDSAIKKGEIWSPAKIEEVFKQDVIKHERFKQDVTVPLNQNQFDALSSFAFNLGSLYNNDGTKTTLLTLLNKGDYKGASNQILRFKYQGTTFLQGLLNRRIKEKKLFDTPITPKASVTTDKNEVAVTDAKAKAKAELNAQIQLSEKLRLQDAREELAENEKIKKAELTKDAQKIAQANADAKRKEVARKVASDLLKDKNLKENQKRQAELNNSYNSNNPIVNTPSQPRDAKEKTLQGAIKRVSSDKVLKSGFTLLGLIVTIVLLNNIELPTTELE